MLVLNTIRQEFADFLSADPTRWRMDAALAHVVGRAYRQGIADAAGHGTALAHGWRRPEDIPLPATTAIIAGFSDDGEEWILHWNIHHYIGGQWIDEVTGNPLDVAEYRWMPESELVGGLGVPV